MRNRLLFALAAAALICGVAFGMAIPASAQTSNDPSPPMVTDFANYPLGLGIIPATCTSQGPDAVVGERFSVDGGPEVTDLRFLNLQAPAQAVTMLWDSFAPGCENVGVALSIKSSGAVVFDPTINQYGLRTAYCGPEAGAIPCAAPHELTLVLAPATGDPGVPCYQVDASLGPSLAIVGPSGSFYGILNGKFNMLISAWNGGINPCGTPVPPPTTIPSTTTTTTEPPPVTTTSIGPIIVSTSSPAQSSTTTTAPTTTTCPPGFSAASGSCVSVAGISATIPRTGPAAARTTGMAGVTLILAGGALLTAAGIVGRRVRRL